MAAEFSRFPLFLSQHHPADWVNVEPLLYQLRRQKEADELCLIRRAIAGTGGMYERRGPSWLRASRNWRCSASCRQPPSNNSASRRPRRVTIINAAPPVAPHAAGRTARTGELYILDLGPAYRGYFADNCRTIAVKGSTDQQQAAWACMLQVFAHVEQHVRPGTSAQELYRQAQAILQAAPLGEFPHHLGHGIGLFPHEAPYINPHWDDHFQVGEVFTIEPGLYASELQCGLRIEQNYLVTPDGVELLSPFPLEM